MKELANLSGNNDKILIYKPTKRKTIQILQAIQNWFSIIVMWWLLGSDRGFWTKVPGSNPASPKLILGRFISGQ